MICTKCGYDSGGSREALAIHMGEVHRQLVPVGFSKPSIPVKKSEEAKQAIKRVVFVGDDLIPLDRVDDDRSASLKMAGYDTYEKIANATISGLQSINGIGRATAKAIKASAEEMLGGSDASNQQGAEEPTEEV